MQTILITRPHHQAGPLCELITTFGGNPIVCPTIEIAEINPILAADPDYPDDCDIAIFVSANAVRHGCSFWRSRKNKNSAVIAIGPGTAAALTQQNIPISAVPAHFSSEGLLALSDLQSIENKHIAIFCGENTRPLLRESLIERGAKVQEIICYRRTIPTLAHKQLEWIRVQPVSAIVATSLESLENLFSMFRTAHQWLCQIPYIVVTHKMAARAKQLGVQQSIIIAENPTDQAIVRALNLTASSTQVQ